jgi:hypothetical protein
LNKNNYYRRKVGANKKLSDRELKTALNEWWRTNIESPSYRQLVEAELLSSTSSIKARINELRLTGFLLSAPFGQARSITPVWVREAIREYYEKHKEELETWIN